MELLSEHKEKAGQEDIGPQCERCIGLSVVPRCLLPISLKPWYCLGSLQQDWWQCIAECDMRVDYFLAKGDFDDEGFTLCCSLPQNFGLRC